MKIFFPLLSFSLAKALCIAPQTPGLTTCGVCDDVRGSQCVTLEGRWLTCHSTYQQCCSDWEVRNHQSDVAQCVSDSQNAASQPTTPSPANVLPDVTDVCKQVASRGTSKSNIQCMNECNSLVSAGGDPKSDALFNQSCVWAHWHATNGRTVVDGPCFEKWIYGYSQENALASFLTGLITATPAQCQALCQDNDACINWAWLSDLYASTGSEKVGRCMLKDETMVSKALSIRTDIIHDPSMDTKYCNYGMPHECSTNHYVCLPCNGGQKRCVWESDMHVTGWKYCTPTDTCSPFPYPPTEVSTVSITTQKPTTTTQKPTTTTSITTTTPRPTTTTPTTPAPTTPEPTTTPITPEPTRTPTTPAPTKPEPTTTPTTPAPTTPEPTTPAPTTPESTTPAPTTPAPTTPEPTTTPTTPAPAPPEPTTTPTTPETTTPKPITKAPEPTTSAAVESESVASQSSTPTTGKSWWPFPDIFPVPLGTKTSAEVESSVECNCPSMAPEQCPSRDSCEPRNDGCRCACGCAPPPPPPPRNDCQANCPCRGKADCRCCKQPMLLIRLADRPKKFQVNLES